MPVKDMTERQPTPAVADLTRLVVQEWQHPTEQSDQPIVLLDRSAPGGARHVFVVWDRWNGLEQLQRSEAIMDAAEEVLGKDEALRVTVAMGLTKEEAKRLNIRFE
jgi:hypothetical protein